MNTNAAVFDEEAVTGFGDRRGLQWEHSLSHHLQPFTVASLAWGLQRRTTFPLFSRSIFRGSVVFWAVQTNSEIGQELLRGSKKEGFLHTSMGEGGFHFVAAPTSERHLFV